MRLAETVDRLRSAGVPDWFYVTDGGLGTGECVGIEPVSGECGEGAPVSGECGEGAPVSGECGEGAPVSGEGGEGAPVSGEGGERAPVSGGWSVYYSERGRKTPLESCADEDAACRALLRHIDRMMRESGRGGVPLT
jgi:hypothetical protein